MVVTLEDIITATEFESQSEVSAEMRIKMQQVQESSAYRSALEPVEIYYFNIGKSEYSTVEVVKDAIGRYWVYSYEIMRMLGTRWACNTDLRAEKICMRPCASFWDQHYFLMSRPKWILESKHLKKCGNLELYSNIYQEIIKFCSWLITLESSQYIASKAVKLICFSNQDLMDELERRKQLTKRLSESNDNLKPIIF